MCGIVLRENREEITIFRKKRDGTGEYMERHLVFYLNSILLGVGLAMDAFCVSMANGLNEPEMGRPRMAAIAGTFCGYQILMPLIGWACIHTIAVLFEEFQKFIPWIALLLLLWLGGKMLMEGLQNKQSEEGSAAVGFWALMLQGIATSIDALSVGFTIAEADALSAVIEAVIIGVVTFLICMAGLMIGRKFGTKLAGKASILGGIILIAIGIEIFLKGILG